MRTTPVESSKANNNRQNAEGKAKPSGLQELFRKWTLLRQMLSDKGYRMNPLSVLQIAACLIYAIWPLDIIPDFFLGFGQVDDLVILSYGFTVLTKMLGDYEKHLENKGPSKAGH